MVGTSQAAVGWLRLSYGPVATGTGSRDFPVEAFGGEVSVLRCKKVELSSAAGISVTMSVSPEMGPANRQSSQIWILALCLDFLSWLSCPSWED